MIRGAAIATALLFASCSKPALQGVEVDGCVEVHRDGRCEVQGGETLTLWVPRAAGQAVELTPAANSRAEIQGGARYTLVAPAPPAQIELQTPSGRWRSTLMPVTPDRPAQQRFQAARKALRSGDTAGAVTLSEAAVTLAEQSGLARTGSDALSLIAFIQTDRLRDFSAAQQALDRQKRFTAHYAKGAARTAYYQGLLDRERGTLRAARQQLRHAMERSDRIGDARIRRMADIVGVAVLGVLSGPGAAAEALKAQLQSLPEDAAATDIADLASSLCGYGLWHRELGGNPPDLLAHCELALRHNKKGTRVHQVHTARINLALAAIFEGQAQVARAQLQALEAGGASPEVHEQIWILGARGRLALLEGEINTAREHFFGLRRLGDALRDREARWRALLGLARCAAADGESEASLALLQEAEALLDAVHPDLMQGEGLLTFVVQRSPSAALLVDGLQGAGRSDEALAAARRSIARVHGALQLRARISTLTPQARQQLDALRSQYEAARNAWEKARRHQETLPADAARQHAREVLAPLQTEAGAAFDALVDALPSPSPRSAAQQPLAPGELLLHPSPRGYWLFAGHTTKLVARHSDAFPSAELMRQLTRAAPPASARRIIAPPGLAPRELAEQLAQLGPVARRVGIAAQPWSGPAKTALVVADPSENLSAARREGRRTRDLLRARGWQVQLLEGREATGPAVRAALRGIELFHYAGHADAGGDDGLWRNRLRLAAEPGRPADALTPADLLFAAEAPRLVVLMACESGGSQRGVAAELSLAEAFIGAGSALVIATTDAVDDDVAIDLAAKLYDRGFPESGGTRALHAALQEVPPEHRQAFAAYLP